MGAVDISSGYHALHQFIRQVDGKYPVNGIATSSWASHRHGKTESDTLQPYCLSDELDR